MPRERGKAKRQYGTLVVPHLMTDFDGLASAVAAWKLHGEEGVVCLPGAVERSVERYLEEFAGQFPVARGNEVDLEAVRRLIVVDTGRWERLGPLKALKKRSDLEVLLYDHHGDAHSDLPAQNRVTEPYGANVSALVELLRREDIPIYPQEATLFAIGIYEDTGMLTFAGITTHEFDAAKFLLARGAKMALARRFLPAQLEYEQWGLLRDIEEHLEFINDDGVRIALGVKDLGHTKTELAVIAQRLMDTVHPDGLILVLQIEERVHVIARSSGPHFDAGSLCARLGGGGHVNAASATVRDATLVQVEAQVRHALPSAVETRLTLREVMSYPVRWVPPEASLADALAELNKFHVNNLCVLESDVLVGVVNRQIVDRAVHHGLGDMAVSEHMTTDFRPVPPEMPLMEAKLLLLRHHLHFAPVVEGERLVGVVSRTDLLKLLFSRELQETSREFDRRPDKTHTKSLAGLMRQHLDSYFLDKITDVTTVADTLGVQVCLVGGIVRDILLGRSNEDIDVVVEGDGIHFAKELANHIGGRLNAVPKFGTAKVKYPDGYYVDVASARMEYYEHPVALPTVEHGSIRQDLYRRDFTVNAIAAWLNSENFGEIIDPFGGREDLKAGRIRVIHSLSFLEDPTRILRAVRFATRFGFDIEKQTQRFLAAAIKRDIFAELSGERFLNELRHLLKSSHRQQAMAMLDDLNVLSSIHKDLAWTPGADDLFNRLDGVLGWYRMSQGDPAVNDWFVYFAAMCLGFGKKSLRDLQRRLRLTREQLGVLEGIVQGVPQLELDLRNLGPDAPPSRVYEACEAVPMEALLVVIARHPNQPLAEAVTDYIKRLRTVTREIDGNDLRSIGVPAGPPMGEILKQVLFARMDGLVRNKSEELAYAKRVAQVQ